MPNENSGASSPVIGGSWHGHSIPGFNAEVRLMPRDSVPARPSAVEAVTDVEVYHLHTVSHRSGLPTKWYSRHDNSAAALAEMLGYAAGTITDEMITAALSRLPGPNIYRPLAQHPEAQAHVQVATREQGFDMIKTLWTVMQRARR